MPLIVATANVNGIRAAVRRGIESWIATRTPDVLLLQEVRAPDKLVREVLDGWHVAHAESEVKGRAGVVVASRLPLGDVRTGLATHGPDGAAETGADTGRWVEADVRLPDGGTLTAVSAYLHSGSTTPGQEHTMVAKYAYLEKVTARLAELSAAQVPAVVAGDLNIAHQNVDIKNWKGNQKSAGFLPEERAYVTRWIDEHRWTDLGRSHAGDGPGPYTWWSWRGAAFDNDSGWRIDYQLANPALAGACRKVEVDRAPTYAERWSDHAPVVATYEL
ncbi:exodeoxyribonuclease III [Promicromonospora sp. NPDC090134]|uniref:exodeoxyribonuclease III n=1 Tax=Promicromonospora sp. NPDC090134 TaxID=3364408 RepID=UPI0038100843